MIIVLSSILIFVIIAVTTILKNRKAMYKDYVGVWLSALLPICVLLMLVVIRATGYSDIERFHAAKSTINYQRQITDDHYERAALVQSIVEYNAWLSAQQRYATDPAIGWFIPNDVLFLTPIE